MCDCDNDPSGEWATYDAMYRMRGGLESARDALNEARDAIIATWQTEEAKWEAHRRCEAAWEAVRDVIDKEC